MTLSFARLTLMVLFAGVCSTAQKPADTPAIAPVKHSCSVEQPTPATDASRALRARDYAKAESLYRDAAVQPGADEAAVVEATAGLTRTLLTEGKTRDAVDTAREALKAHPGNAVILDALGEVYFRRGETDKAAAAYNASAKADFCSARIHYDMARFLHLDGQFASEQKELDTAHKLAPRNNNINRARARSTSTETLEDTIDRLTEKLESGELSPDAKATLQRTVDVLRARSRGSCEIVKPIETAEIPMVSIANGPTDMYAAGLEVTLNGHKKRFELDTGASGLLLSSAVAKSAGLISEAESSGFGVGDGGVQRELLAHVDDIRIGPLEFHNCLVRIADRKNALDVDGLIGADVFSSYLVTLDLPGRMVRLGPLPKRPDDQASAVSLDTSGSDANDNFTPRDRYVAPEMKNWTRVFRSGHNILFPTRVNDGPERLFIMDTGASHEGLVSIAAAGEVTSLGSSDRVIKGISGTVSNVKSAEAITLMFGGVREQLNDVPAVDLSSLGRNAGTEISGLIGFFTLRELVLTIDYRDSLVHVVYDPKHGFHRHG